MIYIILYLAIGLFSLFVSSCRENYLAAKRGQILNNDYESLDILLCSLIFIFWPIVLVCILCQLLKVLIPKMIFGIIRGIDNLAKKVVGVNSIVKFHRN